MNKGNLENPMFHAPKFLCRPSVVRVHVSDSIDQSGAQDCHLKMPSTASQLLADGSQAKQCTLETERDKKGKGIFTNFYMTRKLKAQVAMPIYDLYPIPFRETFFLPFIRYLICMCVFQGGA
jgi:hypothetical protein